MYSNISHYIPIYSNTSQCVSVYCNMLQYPVGNIICQHVPLYRNIFQHIPTFSNFSNTQFYIPLLREQTHSLNNKEAPCVFLHLDARSETHINRPSIVTPPIESRKKRISGPPDYQFDPRNAVVLRGVSAIRPRSFQLPPDGQKKEQRFREDSEMSRLGRLAFPRRFRIPRNAEIGKSPSPFPACFRQHLFLSPSLKENDTKNVPSSVDSNVESDISNTYISIIKVTDSITGTISIQITIQCTYVLQYSEW